MASFRFLVFLCFVSIFLLSLQIRRISAQQVPCFFIFGDSLADSGNNNLLHTTSKANSLPYGMDFPSGTTGRFTNGRTVVDILAQVLGFEDFIPSFTRADDSQILHGVNYASGSAGILDKSGNGYGIHVSLNQQLRNHRKVISRIGKHFQNGSLAASDHLSKCLYYVGMGSNDYFEFFFSPTVGYTITQYTNILIRQYSKQLKTLYKYGARKLVVNGLLPLGCVPYARSHVAGNNSIKLCSEEMNNAGELFDKRLKSLHSKLEASYADATFVYVDNAGILQNAVAGIGNIEEGCCQVNDIGLCIPGKVVCPNRDLYVFWDSFHPTEASNIATASLAFGAIALKLF